MNFRFQLTALIKIILVLLFTSIFIFKYAIPAQISAQTPLPPSITFLGGWDQGDIIGPGAWNMAQWMAPDRFKLVTDRVRKGKYSVRIEVRPGDDPISSGGERSEVSVMRDPANNLMWENESSGTQYYAISVYLPRDWRPPSCSVDGNKFGTFFQLHGPDINHTSPAFELGALDNFYLFTLVGNMDYRNIDETKCISKRYSFSDGHLNLGGWTDFVIKIKFAKTYTGSVDIWRRDEGRTNFTNVLSLTDVPTLQYKTSVNNGAVGNHYWKTGYYRSPETYTNILWIDGPTRGNTYDAVVNATFPSTTPTQNPTFTPTATPNQIMFIPEITNK